MIRIDAGEAVWLVTQAERAALAARLIGCIGNDRFAPPPHAQAVAHAAELTAIGWEESHVLDPAGLPLDDDDLPLEIALAAWLASAQRAAGVDPYVGLLVSVNALAFSAVRAGLAPARGATRMPRFQFEVNRFQNRVIELQENLRSVLGLRVDRPLRLGLADGWTEPAEEALRSDVRWLEAADLLALAIVRGRAVGSDPGPVYRRLKEPSVTLHLDRTRADRLLISPWPFDAVVLEARFAYRSIAPLPLASPAALADAFAHAPPESFGVAICPG